jgi:hypothetical protein
MSSALIFTSNWTKWYRVLRYRKGFGLIDSVRFSLWLARGGVGAASSQELGEQVHLSA